MSWPRPTSALASGTSGEMCPMAGGVAIRMRAICLPPSSAQALDDFGEVLFSLAAAKPQVAPQDLPEQHVGCRHQLRESNLPATGIEAREDAGKRPVDPSRMLPSTVLGHFSNHGQAVFLSEEPDDGVAKTLVAVEALPHRRRWIVLRHTVYLGL